MGHCGSWNLTLALISSFHPSSNGIIRWLLALPAMVNISLCFYIERIDDRRGNARIHTFLRLCGLLFLLHRSISLHRAAYCCCWSSKEALAVCVRCQDWLPCDSGNGVRAAVLVFTALSSAGRVLFALPFSWAVFYEYSSPLLIREFLQIVVRFVRAIFSVKKSVLSPKRTCWRQGRIWNSEEEGPHPSEFPIYRMRCPILSSTKKDLFLERFQRYSPDWTLRSVPVVMLWTRVESNPMAYRSYESILYLFIFQGVREWSKLEFGVWSI